MKPVGALVTATSAPTGFIVHFVAQCHTESGQGLRCIILAAIETLIYDILDATEQGMEEGIKDKCADDDRYIDILLDDRSQESL